MASEKCSKEFIGFTREQIHDPISSRPLEAFTWGSLAKVILCGGPSGGGQCGCVCSYMFVPTYCIHTYIRTYVYVHTYVHAYIHICTYVQLCIIYVHMCIHTYVYHMHTDPFTAVYVYTYCVYHTYVRTLCQHSDWFYIRII